MESTRPQTVRFWTMDADSPVRLTLREGAPIRFVTGGPHDEGFSYTHHEYRLEDGRVYSRVYNRSRCCDGPTESTWEGSIPTSRLAWHRLANGPESVTLPDGHMLPVLTPYGWTTHNHAEAAGY